MTPAASLGRRSVGNKTVLALNGPAMSTPTKASGAWPRLTSSSTLVRPARRAASTAASTCAGVVTAWRLTDMITIAAAEALFGRVAARIDRGDDHAASVGGQVERADDLRVERLQRQAERGAAGRPALPRPAPRPHPPPPAWRASSSSVGRWPTCDLQRLTAAVADDLDRHAAADRGVGDEVADRLVRRDVLAVDPDDDVALLDSGLGRRARPGRPSGRSRRDPWAGRAMRRYFRRAAGGRRRDSRAAAAGRGAAHRSPAWRLRRGWRGRCRRWRRSARSAPN